MYTVEALVLRRNDYRLHETVLTLFSRDFGRFDAFYRVPRTSPKVDVGTLLQGFVSTKKGKNSLREVTKIHTVDTQKWRYTTYESFLWFLSMSHRLLPEGNAYIHLFDDIKKIYKPDHRNTHDEIRIIFLVLRLLVIFGIHQVTENAGLSAILAKIRNAKYEDIAEQISLLDPQSVRDYAQGCCDHFFLHT